MTAILAEASTPSRQVQADPRADAYGLLAAAFRYPDPALFGALAGGSWLAQIAEACSELGRQAAAPDSLPAPSIAAEAGVEYTRLFDAGPAGPPCSLNEGHYRGERVRVIEELLRFFDHFGVRFEPASGLMPDHLSVELEFMAALARAERRHDDLSALLAQRDFLERHLCGWLQQLADCVSQHAELPLYPALTAFTLAFVQADVALVTSQLLEGSP